MTAAQPTLVRQAQVLSPRPAGPGVRRRRPVRIRAEQGRERLATSANAVTFARTLASVVLAALAAHERSLLLLSAALGVYWLGDMLDGAVARRRDCETRIGAVLDILCDRLCCAAFYVGLAWLEPTFAVPVFVYLAQFMVLDHFVSLAFLAWPITSPNYFYVVDRRLFAWNWSKPGKALNSALFAVVLIATGSAALGLGIALGLVIVKTLSLRRLLRIGMPIPAAGPQPVPAP
jgi:CDP-diacylglycerol--glycerol-3-phosphate 3-phosphatidyltransferase